ncbi:hypothetical protein EKO04_008213 [Ascochyta lentis]|uniref:Mitochondrial resolvase Ydc2 catalytic domain-containing protein n=1 Tax=Ascochyta lentis TaxID=205686 RepID=A0A8H7MGF0_9PLEO|nr:hypothetical protein EKO04_008213 [Ascochyta lentis]
MAPRKPTVTAKVLQALLTRIGSASSGTKSTLLARFQREIQQPSVFHRLSEGKKQPHKPWNRKLRVVSIDMGIKNLAFCDAEVVYPATESASEPSLHASMNILRWKKIDLVGSTSEKKNHLLSEASESAEDDANPYSPSVLSRTAHRLIKEEVLSVNPDIILIEKQRWRSGGGSAVQQWTVRVNTLEAMLWAILETLKPTAHGAGKNGEKHGYRVYAVDPKRVGQYWLSRHARALEERNEQLTTTTITTADEPEPEPEIETETPRSKTPPPQPRSKAEKSAKLSLLRSWLTQQPMSTTPSTPLLTPCISFHVAPAAQRTLHAVVPSQGGSVVRRGRRGVG